jgi:hypothetical protein
MLRKDFVNRSHILKHLRVWAETHPSPDQPTNAIIPWIKMTPREFVDRASNRASFLKSVVEVLREDSASVKDRLQDEIEANLRPPGIKPVREVLTDQIVPAHTVADRLVQVYGGRLQQLPGVRGIGIQVGKNNTDCQLRLLVTSDADRKKFPRQIEGLPVRISKIGGFVSAKKSE